MASAEPSFSQVTIKTIVVHTVTYFTMGVFALLAFDYAALYARPDMAGLMRQTTDPRHQLIGLSRSCLKRSCLLSVSSIGSTTLRNGGSRGSWRRRSRQLSCSPSLACWRDRVASNERLTLPPRVHLRE